MSDKKCEELVDDRLAGRLEDLLPDWDDEELVKTLADDFDTDREGVESGDDLKHAVMNDHRDRACEGVLSVEVRKSYRVLLSWGGPSDGFDFVFNSEGELIECEYFYQDWFDGAKRPVPMDQAEELVQLYYVGPEFK
jgi:hypothetical protein